MFATGSTAQVSRRDGHVVEQSCVTRRQLLGALGRLRFARRAGPRDAGPARVGSVGAVALVERAREQREIDLAPAYDVGRPHLQVVRVGGDRRLVSRRDVAGVAVPVVPRDQQHEDDQQRLQGCLPGRRPAAGTVCAASYLPGDGLSSKLAGGAPLPADTLVVAAKQVTVRQVDEVEHVLLDAHPRLQRVVENGLLQSDEDHIRGVDHLLDRRAQQ
jgi:hypothetical protein